jgi:hypothetical protein
MLDAARITLSDHRTYDLSRFYIVCTSNIGSQQLLRPTRLPFATLERAVLSELHRFFRPELVGRIDEKIVFKPFTPETQRKIGELVIFEELDRFRKQGFELSMSEPAFEFLLRRGFHTALGARPMKGVVRKFIGDAIRDVLKCSLQPSGTIVISPANDRLMLTVPAVAQSTARLCSEILISAPEVPEAREGRPENHLAHFGLTTGSGMAQGRVEKQRSPEGVDPVSTPCHNYFCPECLRAQSELIPSSVSSPKKGA